MRLPVLSPNDLAQLAEQGIEAAEAERQLALFFHPPRPPKLLRPCTVGDGILRVGEVDQPQLLVLAEEAARAGRLMKFVPASGAATRMFRALEATAEHRRGCAAEELAQRAAQGDRNAADTLAFFGRLEQMALAEELAAELTLRGLSLEHLLAFRNYPVILAHLLGADGMEAAALPKALLPFHRGGQGPLTAFEEQLVEGAAYLRDSAGHCRFHFTVAAPFLNRFEVLLERARERFEAALGARFEVSFSIQDPASETLAVDMLNRPFRRPDGRLLLRPGGHGALLRNLGTTGGDLVVVKNIDNVLPARRQAPVVRWQKLLIGKLVEVERRIQLWQCRLAAAELTDRERAEALSFCAATLGSAAAFSAATASREQQLRFLAERLERPLRVCGVVANRGEPGGAPFWVANSDGESSLQIVEASQIDGSSPEQVRIFSSATHFNPVDLVVSLRNADGKAYDLSRFVDSDSVFIAHKSIEGRDLKALELPGLWNGAMAGWNTLFVEVPAETFAPVKTVLDLARPEHAGNG